MGWSKYCHHVVKSKMTNDVEPCWAWEMETAVSTHLDILERKKRVGTNVPQEWLREVGGILKLFLSPSRRSCSSPFPLAPAPFPWAGRLRSSWHFPAVSTVTKLRAMSMPCPCRVHALRCSNLSAFNELWLKVVDAGHWQVSDPHVIYSIIFLNFKISHLMWELSLIFHLVLTKWASSVRPPKAALSSTTSVIFFCMFLIMSFASQDLPRFSDSMQFYS